MKVFYDPVIFIVDKNTTFQKVTQQYLNVAGYTESLIFSDYSECIKYLDLKPDIVISDYFDTPPVTSEDFINKLKKISPKTYVIFLSSSGDLNNAITLMQKGAIDYILKSNSAYNRLIHIIKSIHLYNTDLIKTSRSNKTIATSIGILAALMGFLLYLYKI